MPDSVRLVYIIVLLSKLTYLINQQGTYMNKFLPTLKCFYLVIITIGTLYATTDQFMYHGAILAILAGITLALIEDAEYAFGY